MWFNLSSLLTVSLAALSTASKCGYGLHPHRGYKHDLKPAYFVLAGDSTTTTQNSGGGGWGAGFLNDTLCLPAGGKNYGKNGRTTVSFREDGYWADVLERVENKTDSYEVYVTIQFGHNDQKPKANITLDEYSANLGQFVKDVRSSGGTPILVTPLTRRQFSGDPPLIKKNLANERNATIAVAKSLHARYIDLNLASQNYVNALGPDAAWDYNLDDEENDTTHLNNWGSVVFGRLVSDLMMEKYDDIAYWTKPNAGISEAIANGIPA